jgi:LysM repeat protein
LFIITRGFFYFGEKGDFMYEMSGDYYIPMKIRMPNNTLKSFTLERTTQPSDIYEILAKAVEKEIVDRYQDNSEVVLKKLKTAEDFSNHFVEKINSGLDARIKKSFLDVQNAGRRAQRAQIAGNKADVKKALEDLELILQSSDPKIDGNECVIDPKLYADIQRALQTKKVEDLQGFFTAKFGDYFESLLAKFINKNMSQENIFAMLTGRQRVQFNESTSWISRKVDVELKLTEDKNGNAIETIGLNVKGQFPKSLKSRQPKAKYFETSSQQMRQYSGWTAELINFLAYKRLVDQMAPASLLGRQIGAANASLAIGGFLTPTQNDRALFIVTGDKVESLSQKLRKMQEDNSKRSSLQMSTNITNIRIAGAFAKKPSGEREKQNLYYSLQRKKILASYEVRFYA